MIIAAAKLGGELLGRLGQPPVAGELLAGVLLGNLGLFGFTALEPLRESGLLRVVAEFGAILLLFEVGVESELKQLLAVGWSSLVVAALGVAVPMALGYAVSLLLLPNANWLTHLFVGGTLTATSVGITARVLKDLGRADTREARIILGAAVADDVIGLLVLAVVSGLVTAAAQGSAAPGGFEWGQIAWIGAKASGFLVAAVLLGRFGFARIFAFASRLKGEGTLLALCICFCFLVSGAAAAAGLAPIVGAFAAGVMLEDAHYKPFLERGERRVEELLFPITTLLVPVFFVVMGMRVDLRSFASGEVLLFAGLVTLVAVAGKLICGLGVLERGVNRLAIGVGMIPRGEVGLIFAGLGSTLLLGGVPVVGKETFSTLVLVVMLTTLFTPPALKLALERQRTTATEAP